jgi:hypothetical protein
VRLSPPGERSITLTLVAGEGFIDLLKRQDASLGDLNHSNGLTVPIDDDLDVPDLGQQIAGGRAARGPRR